VVEVSFEYVAPVAALLIIAVTVWGASRKFTDMDNMIRANHATNQHDIAIIENNMKRLEADVKALNRDVKQLSEEFIKLKQRVEDGLNSH
jgi:hypothetical protein